MAIDTQKPYYFGPVLRALQGPPERHRYFQPLIKAAVESRPEPLHILEIGSWAGASTVSLAFALRDLNIQGTITCVDPWNPYFDEQQNKEGDIYREMSRAAESGEIYQLFLHNIASAGIDHSVRIQRGTSRERLPELESQSFDVIYVDGSHLYHDVSFDLQQAKRLIRAGGILSGDDLELQRHQLNWRELDDSVDSGKDLAYCKLGHYHPGVTLAVSEQIGTVDEWQGFWAVRRRGREWYRIKLDLSEAVIPQHIRSFMQL